MVHKSSLALLIALLTTSLLLPVSRIPSLAAASAYSQKEQLSDIQTGKININTAGAKELALVKGIGPKTAKRIVAYRRKNGKFKHLRGLLGVKGIGEKKLKKFEPFLRI